ncbi:MAG: ribosomal L7Ae/L30e/S12e/Gadd45 family protein [Candidatus Pacearchaeota archaeon]|nr:ribosomal L7Ae/L30e/S12e/Gadd45 family protein [Candidatus Pacearchaeota archaeon]
MNDPNTEELLEDLNKKVIFGMKRTLKFLKKGKVEKIYIASDAPPAPIKGNVKIIRMKQNKEELKEICKKRFNISFVSVLKE